MTEIKYPTHFIEQLSNGNWKPAENYFVFRENGSMKPIEFEEKHEAELFVRKKRAWETVNPYLCIHVVSESNPYNGIRVSKYTSKTSYPGNLDESFEEQVKRLKKDGKIGPGEFVELEIKDGGINWEHCLHDKFNPEKAFSKEFIEKYFKKRSLDSLILMASHVKGNGSGIDRKSNDDRDLSM